MILIPTSNHTGVSNYLLRNKSHRTPLIIQIQTSSIFIEIALSIHLKVTCLHLFLYPSLQRREKSILLMDIMMMIIFGNPWRT